MLSGSLSAARRVLRLSADGAEGLRMWRVAASILNKQSRTADNGWSSSLMVGRWSNTSSPYKETF
jgi:hypothetical protein